MISLIQLLLEVSIDQLRQQWVDSNKMSPEVFDRICQATENNSNWATWMVKRVSQGYIADEDIEQWHDFIKTFERYKVRFQTKDINTLKTPDQIANFAHECVTVQQAADERIANSGGEKMKGSKEERKREVDQFRLPDYKSTRGNVFEVYKLPKDTPENQKYAIELGTGTTWCTASRGNSNFYRAYNSKGPLYIFINKADPDEKYQIHIESDQFKNSKDREINYYDRFYIDFYKYLQRIEHIKLPRKAQEAVEKVEELGKYKQTHNIKEEIAKRKIEGYIHPGEQWYRLDLDKKDDRFISYTLDTRLGKSSIVCFCPTVDYLFTYTQSGGGPDFIHKGDGYIVNPSKVIESEKDYNNFNDLLKKNNFSILLDGSVSFIAAQDWNRLKVMYDKSLPSEETFYVGKIFDKYPVYYFDKSKGDPIKAKTILKVADNAILSSYYYDIFVFSPDSNKVFLKFNLKVRNVYESLLFRLLGTNTDTYSGFNSNLEQVERTVQELNRLFKDKLNSDIETVQTIRNEAEQVDKYINTVPKEQIDNNKYVCKRFPPKFKSLPILDSIDYPISDKVSTDINVYQFSDKPVFLLINTSTNGVVGLETRASDNRTIILSVQGTKVSGKTELARYGFTPQDVADAANILGIEFPIFVKKILDRDQSVKKGTVTPSVKELLNLKSNEFKECDITKVRHRTVEGIEGTWQDFGPSICKMSDHGEEMQKDLQDNNWTARIVLYWNGDDWNMFCQMKDQDGNVKKIWERIGRGIGVSWKKQNINTNLHESFIGTGYSRIIAEYL